MPLSSLAAEPARITIANEAARGESNFFQAFSLPSFLPSGFCFRHTKPGRTLSSLSLIRDVVGRQSLFSGGRES